MYINGQLVEGKGAPIDVINPATGKVIATFRGASEAQAEEALKAAQTAFKTWSFTSINEKLGWLYKLRDTCLAKKEEIIDILAQETGKAYADNEGDFARFISYFEYYGEEAKRIYDVGLPEYDGHRDLLYRVLRRPIGVVVGHLAWNVPMINLGAKLTPVMASGCTCVLKPSVSTPLASLKVAEIAAQIGMPAGVFNMVSGPSSVIGKYLNENKIPAMVTCIGSTATGIEIMKQVATSIKKVSLELGGNAPCIIMPDADLDVATTFVANRKVAQTGQSCGCVNRIYVHSDVHDEFTNKLVEKVKAFKMGWGKDTPKLVGSLIDKNARERLLALVKDGVDRGAKLLYGGDIPDLPEQFKDGAFMTPSILDNVKDDMPVAAEELFGPVYPILTFNDLDDVIARSNDTTYGLCSFLFTHDSRVIVKCMEQLQFGRVVVNAAPILGANLPHTGHKQSGIGTLFGTWSLDQYYSVKLVALKP
jgi:succinate-semialdehyde dehydrogenase/glutarate-semialdehyde dehydrogenase